MKLLSLQICLVLEVIEMFVGFAVIDEMEGVTVIDVDGVLREDAENEREKDEVASLLADIVNEVGRMVAEGVTPLRLYRRLLDEGLSPKEVRLLVELDLEMRRIEGVEDILWNDALVSDENLSPENMIFVRYPLAFREMLSALRKRKRDWVFLRSLLQSLRLRLSECFDPTLNGRNDCRAIWDEIRNEAQEAAKLLAKLREIVQNSWAKFLRKQVERLERRRNSYVPVGESWVSEDDILVE